MHSSTPRHGASPRAADRSVRTSAPDDWERDPRRAFDAWLVKQAFRHSSAQVYQAQWNHFIDWLELRRRTLRTADAGLVGPVPRQPGDRASSSARAICGLIERVYDHLAKQQPQLPNRARGAALNPDPEAGWPMARANEPDRLPEPRGTRGADRAARHARAAHAGPSLARIARPRARRGVPRRRSQDGRGAGVARALSRARGWLAADRRRRPAAHAPHPAARVRAHGVRCVARRAQRRVDRRRPRLSVGTRRPADAQGDRAARSRCPVSKRPAWPTRATVARARRPCATRSRPRCSSGATARSSSPNGSGFEQLESALRLQAQWRNGVHGNETRLRRAKRKRNDTATRQDHREDGARRRGRAAPSGLRARYC